MRKCLGIAGIVFCLFVADSFITAMSALGQTWDSSSGSIRNGKNTLAVVQILLYKGNDLVTGGSGFFVNEDGYLLTAYHVIEQARYDHNIRTLVNFERGLYPVDAIAFDEKNDIAVLRVTATTPITFVRFADSDAIASQSKVIICAVPPTGESSAGGSFIDTQNRLVSENHRVILIKNTEDVLADPDAKAFIKNEEIQKILIDPSMPGLVSDPMAQKYLPYPQETVDLLVFFLLNRDSRIFFSDDDKRTKAGWSGGAGFNEAGYCIAMFQEIIAVLKPNPATRYVDPTKPPSNNSLFPLLEKMMGAGQNSNNLMAFLGRNGIKYYRTNEQPLAYLQGSSLLQYMPY